MVESRVGVPMSAWILIAAVLIVGVLFVLGAKRAGGNRDAAIAAGIFVAIIAIDLLFARSGILGRFDRFPPPLMPFFLIGIVGVAFAIAFSPLGKRLATGLPFSALIGFQAFRVLAELTIFAGVHEGIAPKQLSFEGYNFDIVTAITAALLGWSSRTNVKRGLVVAWNYMGIAFLLIIAFIAITSMPVPFRVFMGEPTNEWVTRAPYVLLPGVLVTAALCGHLLVFRKLAQRK